MAQFRPTPKTETKLSIQGCHVNYAFPVLVTGIPSSRHIEWSIRLRPNSATGLNTKIYQDEHLFQFRNGSRSTRDLAKE